MGSASEARALWQVGLSQTLDQSRRSSPERANEPRVRFKRGSKMNIASMRKATAARGTIRHRRQKGPQPVSVPLVALLLSALLDVVVLVECRVALLIEFGVSDRVCVPSLAKQEATLSPLASAPAFLFFFLRVAREVSILVTRVPVSTVESFVAWDVVSSNVDVLFGGSTGKVMVDVVVDSTASTRLAGIVIECSIRRIISRIAASFVMFCNSMMRSVSSEKEQLRFDVARSAVERFAGDGSRDLMNVRA